MSLVGCASQQLGTGRLQSSEPTVTSFTPSLLRQQTPAKKQGSLSQNISVVDHISPQNRVWNLSLLSRRTPNALAVGPSTFPKPTEASSSSLSRLRKIRSSLTQVRLASWLQRHKSAMSNENEDLLCVVCVCCNVMMHSYPPPFVLSPHPAIQMTVALSLDVAAAPSSTQKKQETFNAIHLQVSQISTSSSSLCSSELRPLL